MAIATKDTSLSEALAPASQAGVVEVVRAAYETGEAVYPQGGGTALDYGSAPSQPGRTLDLTGLSKVVDYAPRDMTILVEAGVRMADLAATLDAEGQRLPIDVPRASEATIGGVVATNWNGPRRYGLGTVRDYVIGINAVDGRGVAFKGGGRVVKNVAGYDFCKLLTGSLGTLGIITQMAFKVTPRAEVSAAIVADCRDLNIAESALGRLANLEGLPVAIDLLIGSAWAAATGRSDSAGACDNQIVVRVEGTGDEVFWLTERVQAELSAAGSSEVRRLDDEAADRLWERQIAFSDRGAGEQDDNSPFVVQIAVLPSAVTGMIAHLTAIDANCVIQAHAASGIIIARFAKFTHAELSAALVGKLRPAAVQLGGSLVVLRSKLEGLTSHLIWGGRTDAVVLLERIKQKFDPKNILNSGRYVF